MNSNDFGNIIAYNLESELQRGAGLENTEEEKTVLRGLVEDIVYQNRDTGYGVVDIDADGEIVTLTGDLAEVGVGEELEVYGRYTRHVTYGLQFKCEGIKRTLPSTASAIYKYLANKAIAGIGPSTARKLVDAFGDATLEVIANEPEKLASIRGITRIRAAEMSEQFRNIFGLEEAVKELTDMGLSAGEALQLFKIYGADTVTLVQDNPYIICGYPVYKDFVSADSFAGEHGVEATDKRRIRAGLVNTLRHNLGNGHTCLPTEKLIDITARFLEVDRDPVEIELYEGVDEGFFGQITDPEPARTFLTDQYAAEKYIAARIKFLAKSKYREKEDAVREIEGFEKKIGISYEPLQKEAITEALSSGVVVITGGPGTGKTTTVNAILSLCKKHGDKVALCAPTGRAAKRMSEVTGEKAQTIHRLLEVDFSSREVLKFMHNEEKPLKYDVVIVDEMSMVDSCLFSSLLNGLKPYCRLVLVGDSHQLPSVGAGNVLSDIISSGICKVVELEKIFRQAAESLIVVNAHAIMEGNMPDLQRRDKDFFFLSEDRENIPELVADLVARRLPKSYKLNPEEDIQVITPSRLGYSGTSTLNESIRERLNPRGENKKEIRMGSLNLREGDKVMQTKNNYEIVWNNDQGEQGKGVFNGDIGRIQEIDRKHDIISIRFDDRVAKYNFDEARQLESAYAITVHKSQGSEFPAVILTVGDTPRKLCYRNLLYTAVTRARSLLIIIGSEQLLGLMVENDRKMLRYTGLVDFLLEPDV